MARSFGSIESRGERIDGNGMKKQVWRIRYPVTNNDGTAGRKSETVFGLRKDAERRLAQIESAFVPGKTHGLTVAACWEEHYLPYISDLAPRTRQSYESAMRNHVLPRWGRSVMDEIAASDVQHWLASLTSGQARNARAVMRSMFNFALDQDLTESTVMSRRYKLPQASKEKKRRNQATHSLQELRSMLMDARSETWEAAFIFSAFGGMRREEAFAVQWADVEWEDEYCVVHVSRTVQRLGGAVVIGETKTELSEREVVIPKPYCNRLREIALERMGDVWVTEDADGNCACPNNMSNAYKRWHLTHRKYEYVPWKNLRTSYATNLLAEGLDLGMVSKMMGHTRMATTYEHYARPTASHMAESLKGRI